MKPLVTNGLTKCFGNSKALDNVTVELSAGKIYGFVGNNGAGKTTFMRIICGLSSPSSGEFQLFGEKEKHNIQEARKNVGALIESPIFYPDLSARQNLIMQSMLYDNSGREQVDELLKFVGLSDFKKRRVRDFSTGMKQRYGLASALLGNPQLLILDEPLNGLDVEGIYEINQLIIRLCHEQGKTILLSSHLLERLQGVATDYIFIDYGKIVECISATDLRVKAKGNLEKYFMQLVHHDVFGIGGD